MNPVDQPTVLGIDPGLDGGLYSSDFGWPVGMPKAKDGESRTPAMLTKLTDRV